MTASYVPQVGDRIRHRTTDYCIQVEYVGRNILVGTADDGGEQFGFLLPSDVWVKVDKPEPWPATYQIAIRRSTGVATWTSTLAFALSACAYQVEQGVSPADLRIWRSNPDGSVTVLDHTGSEL